jgi:Zn-dependent M28 family amino/carboxypeptidase
MEAVRILRALDLQPRRTVRIALWTGEEQGLLGSRAYVAKHFGRSPTAASGAGDDDRKAARDRFSVYFNLDTGAGRIRGLYLQGNEQARAYFRPWLAPLRDLGVTTLTLASSGGSDHIPFNESQLPGFEFAQDMLEYKTRTHHSSLDLYDRAVADDMKQASVVLATFVYNAATADAAVPRKTGPATR